MSHDTAPESDVETDDGRADSKAIGGVTDPDQPDEGGTTDTGENVGRIAGQDVGYAGETGAERRAAADD